ncbi:MAG: hypothetical protein ACREPG_07370 [Candidatus Binatia bacterium]
MKLSKSKYVRRFFAVASLAAITGAAASTDWFLMGRHGECAPLSSLSRKGPEFRGLQTPYDLINKARAAGHQVDVKEHTTPKGAIVEVHVPAKEIAVMVVTAEFCKAPSR